MNTLHIAIGEGSKVHLGCHVVLPDALPVNPSEDDWLNTLKQPVDGDMPLQEMINAAAWYIAGQLAAQDGTLERKIRIELQIPDTGKYHKLWVEINLTPTNSPGCTIH